MADTFKGGIHPDYQKSLTSSKIIETLPPPETLYIPLSQHRGAPAEPIVAVGDTVFVGTKIADSAAAVTAPIHSSVSGTVKAIEPYYHPSGAKTTCIIIENDGKDTPDPSIKPCDKPINQLTSDEIVAMAREAGLVGMGGAGFPLHFKISSSIKCGKAEALLINGAECEPYLSSDHRIMVERTEQVVEGARMIMRALGLSKVTICTESNKPDAVKALKVYIGDASDVDVKVFDTKYPQGSEKQMIQVAMGREVPTGKLPIDVGAVVTNVDSCGALYRAWKYGTPLYERVVTVTGKIVVEPKVLLCRIGTPFQYAIDYCSGLSVEPGKVIMGGPMMGQAQYTTEVPIIKTTSGILVLSKEEAQLPPSTNCIRCGKCLRTCPTRLLPCYLNMYSDMDNLEELDKLGIDNCIECGACTYVCPARLPLTQKFRLYKAKLGEARRNAAAAKK